MKKKTHKKQSLKPYLSNEGSDQSAYLHCPIRIITDSQYIVQYPRILKASDKDLNQGPVVQSIISLTSSLVVKMLTVLESTIFNSQLF